MNLLKPFGVEETLIQRRIKFEERKKFVAVGKKFIPGF